MLNKLLIYLSIFFLFFGISNSQINYLTPDMVTSRPLGYLSDATAVQWNPALLGVRSSSELLLAVPLTDKFNLAGDQYSLFAKLGKLSIGYVSEYKVDSLVTLPASVYAGFGIPLWKDHLWLGFSTLYSGDFKDTLTTIKHFRFSSSIIYSPFNSLLTTIGVSNMSYAFENMIWNFGAIYSPFEWLSLHANMAYSPQSIFSDSSALSTEIALSLGGMADYLIPSISYNFNTQHLRIGAEICLGSLSMGLIPKLNDGTLVNNVAFARLSSDPTWNTATLTDNYSLSGTSGTDGCLEDAIIWNTANPNDSPEEIMRILELTGGTYKSLFNDLKKLGPANDIFSQIGYKYYGEKKPEIVESNTDFIYSTGNHSIILESVDSSNKPLVTSIVKVKDDFGRNVADLKRNDFYLKDTNYQIVSLNQTNSSDKIMVDIVILQDCSGSMQSIINGVKQNVMSFVNSLNNRGADCHIGGILYGEKIYDVLQPTPNISEFNKFYSVAAATAPGEVSSIAINSATDMKFRKNAKRIFILLSDECAMQNNSTLTESDLVYKMWDVGANLYAVINPREHNAGVVTRLTLGREYNIYESFTSILEKISGDITTTYQLTYKPKEKAAPKKTIINGICTDENNWKVPANIIFTSASGNRINLKANQFTGDYESEIQEGELFSISATHPDYLDINETIDLTNVKKGDTVQKNFVFKVPVTTLQGYVKNELSEALKAGVKIEEEEATEPVINLVSDENGKYETEIKEGKKYLVTAKAPDYIPMTKELDATSIRKGSKLNLDFELVSIQDAIDRGMTFKLKNIFFDSNKWDIKSESEPELMKLVEFMNEYAIVRVEISAHTDAIGSDKANQTLSDNRAKSVVEYLISKGIEQTRLVWKGYGESAPVSTNETDEGRALNRRVEFKLIK